MRIVNRVPTPDRKVSQRSIPVSTVALCALAVVIVVAVAASLKLAGHLAPHMTWSRLVVVPLWFFSWIALMERFHRRPAVWISVNVLYLLAAFVLLALEL